MSYVKYKYEVINGKRTRVWICPFYSRWKSIYYRCYQSKDNNSCKNYKSKGITMCSEWLNFEVFKIWMENQEWEGKDIDKDLLISGNKIYSPETCVFIDRNINCFLTSSKSIRGTLPLGVSKGKSSGTYQSSISIDNKDVFLGFYNDKIKAHNSWQIAKASEAFTIASTQTNLRVRLGLLNFGLRLLKDSEFKLISDY